MSDRVSKGKSQASIQISRPNKEAKGAGNANVQTKHGMNGHNLVTLNGAPQAATSAKPRSGSVPKAKAPAKAATPGPLARLKSAQETLTRTRSALAELEGTIADLSPDLGAARKEIETLRLQCSELEQRLKAVRSEREKIKAERDKVKAERDKVKAERDKAKAERDKAKVVREEAKVVRDEARSSRDEFHAKAALQEYRHAYRKREVDVYKRALKGLVLYPVRLLSNKTIKKIEHHERKIIVDSGLFDEEFYRKTVPDSGEDPLGHFLRAGALDGKNPSENFDVTEYLKRNKECRRSGVNPLVHYIVGGYKDYLARPAGIADSSRSQKSFLGGAVRSAMQGHWPKPAVEDANKQARKRIEVIRGKLLTLGFTDKPLAEMGDIAKNDPDPAARAFAARELALWHMRGKTQDGYHTALEYITCARRTATEPTLRSRLVTVELLCHYHLGQEAEGRAAYERAASDDEVDSNVMLAWVNFQSTPDTRVAQINHVLSHHDIAPVALTNDANLPAYDRLTASENLAKVDNGPLVTVLIAAYDAADMLPTALRSLQEQTWQNLEIVVIDDCSPTDDTGKVVERFAAEDRRISLIRMRENGGAYVARNTGLDVATGAYVTLHDADDWSHPAKIETQVRFMEANSKVMGCTTRQARATSELAFTRWTGEGHFLITNTSSFMFRREQMRADFGYWDTVRFSADNELIRRIQAKWGKRAVKHLSNGPLSFQRDSENSIVANEALGINGFVFGPRKEYRDAQQYYHTIFSDFRYDGRNERSAFPVPDLMKSKRTPASPRHFSVVLASDFRMRGGSALSCAEDLKYAHTTGTRTGIFDMYRYDLGDRTRSGMLDEIREQVDGETVEVLTYGDQVSCDLLILRYPPILQHRLRYVPEISANDIRVIVNQPPMSDYSENGVVRYNLADCAENIRYYFGKDATWHPIGPLVRSALTTHHAEQLHHIRLADEDWHNIIDVNGWSRGPRRRGPQDKLRIGRHSRDSWHKWPASADDIRAAYPSEEGVEVHVLGGAQTPGAVLGSIPRNWIVYNFGEKHPRDFLADIDVWIYFAHPDWIESFGRTIIEAMAVGVPVILPATYRSLFGDAALYATPQNALEIARKLHAEPDTYNEQVETARNYITTQFSYERHHQRLQSLGITRVDKNDAVIPTS